MPEAELSPAKTNDGWWISFWLRWGLLFAIYSYVDALPFGRSFVPLLPETGRLIAPYAKIVNSAAHWLGLHAFGLKMEGQFWSIGLTVLVPVLPALLWTIFDRRHRVNEALHDAVYIAVRYTVAAAMFSYGVAKLIEQQGYPQPAPLEWLRPLGEITTGHVMWTWLGYSHTFQFFAGVNETVGAILLLFRRTTLLGALLIVPVMAYVTALDTTFDVGPAAWAALYGLLALYLVVREWRRLAAVFVLQKSTTPPPSKRLWASPRSLVIARRILWVAMIVITVRAFVVYHIQEKADIGGRYSPLRGIFRVQRFVSDGRVVPQDVADPLRWRTISINWFGDYIRVRRMNESELLWSADPGDPYRFLVASGHGYKDGDYTRLLAKTAAPEEQIRFREMPNYASPLTPGLLPKGNPGQGPLFTRTYSRGQFFAVTFSRSDADHISLQGKIDGAQISADLVRIPDNDLPFSKTRAGFP